jgi:senataxin
VGDFHTAKIIVEAEVASSIHDNDLLLLTRDHPEAEDAALARELHALGFVEGHDGPQGLRVKFYLTDDSQAGNPEGVKRWVWRGGSGGWDWEAVGGNGREAVGGGDWD